MIALVLPHDWSSGAHLEPYLDELLALLPSPVLVVDRPADLVADVRRGGRRIRRRLKYGRLAEIGPDTWLLRPLLPVNEMAGVWLRPVGGVVGRLLAAQIHRAVRDISGADQPTHLWVFSPSEAWLARFLPRSRVIYDVYDDYRYSPMGQYHTLMARADEELCARADVVLVTSRVLAERRRAATRQILYRGNGALDSLGPLARRGREGPPTAVFVGHLRPVIDVDWLFAAAHELGNQIKFQVIGQIHPSLRRDVEESRIEVVGHLPRNQLSEAMASASLGVLPLRRNPYSECLNPYKLHEYRRCWLPVASSVLPSFPSGAPGVIQCETQDRFISAIRDLMYSDPIPRDDEEEIGQSVKRVARIAVDAVNA